MNDTATFPNTHFDVQITSKPTYWHCERGWEWQARPLPNYLMWYIVDGVGLMRLDGTAWELKTGSCFVFKPGSQPHGTQDPDRRLVVFGMHFDVVDAEGRILPDAEHFAPPPGHVIRDTTYFGTLAQRCDASHRRDHELGLLQSQLALKTMILHLWEEILYPAQSAVDLAMDEVLRDIQMEPGKRWSVDDLARRLHLSRAQFVRRFRATTGLSPTRFMIQARLDRARHLIQETNMTLGQIASALGYEDVYFFSRQYKHYAGYPPSTLRRPTTDDRRLTTGV